MKKLYASILLFLGIGVVFFFSFNAVYSIKDGTVILNCMDSLDDDGKYTLGNHAINKKQYIFSCYEESNVKVNGFSKEVLELMKKPNRTFQIGIQTPLNIEDPAIIDLGNFTNFRTTLFSIWGYKIENFGEIENVRVNGGDPFGFYCTYLDDDVKGALEKNDESCPIFANVIIEDSDFANHVSASKVPGMRFVNSYINGKFYEELIYKRGEPFVLN